jgi:predicted MFS family arabinose efflux permease
MESKMSLTLRRMRVLLFGTLLFACFTASLYLTHQNRWWRVAMILLIAFNSWGLVSSYRQRMVRRREKQL